VVSDPQVLKAEEFFEVGEMIERDAALLVERWCERAIADHPSAARCHHQTLRDGLLVLLKQLGVGLKESNVEDVCQHHLQALQHGEQRWEAGWSITEVIHDYQLLRLVIFEFLEETLPRPLTYLENMAIGLALDEAISASVTMYVNFRDEHTRHAEAALLKEQSRRKDEFLAMLGHELRNPLSPILNSLELLSMENTDPAVADNARLICKRQVRQIARLVDDLLDATRISQGKLELRRQLVDLSAAVSAGVESAQPSLESRGHTLEVLLPAGPVQLDVDPARLEQMLANLLNNASKYTEPGGHICVEASRENDQAVVRVRDNGIGIEPVLLPHIFDLFTQSHDAVRKGGLGVGLTLVRRLAEMHGGSVAASSHGAGKGSEFTLRLPANETQANQRIETEGERATKEQRPTTATRSVRILLVDDNKDVVSMLGSLLRRVGHEVAIAHDGPSGLETARRVIPEVILLDIGLPGMNGYELAAELQKLPELAQVCLVAMTGYGQEEDVRRAEQAGFHHHLLKPVRLDDISKVLSRCASRNATL